MLKKRYRCIYVGAAAVLFANLGVGIYLYALGRAADREYQLARTALAQCDFEEAGVHLAKYLAQRPADQAAQLLAARTARRRGDFAVSRRHLELAAKGGGGDDWTLEQALLKFQEGDLSEAKRLASFCKENRSGPKGRAVLEALVLGSLRAREVPIAVWSIDAWVKGSTSNLDLARGKLWSAEVYLKAGQREIAYARYDEAAALAPDFLEAHLAVARALIFTDPHQAGAEIAWLARRAPTRSSVRLVTAQWRRSLGELTAAREMLDQLLAADADNFQAVLERGRVAIDLNDPADAERWLRRALQLAPDHIEANLAMSNCLRLAGRLQEAATFQENARLARQADEKFLDEMLKRYKGR